MTHKHILRPSLNLAARMMGDKWTCKLCGVYFTYDQMLDEKENRQHTSGGKDGKV